MTFLILGKSRIHFWDGGTHTADSITPRVKVIMKMINRGDNFHFNMGYEPRWLSGILHSLKSFIFGTDEGFSLWAYISTHKSDWGLKTEPSERQSSVLCWDNKRLKFIVLPSGSTDVTLHSFLVYDQLTVKTTKSAH
jgi:hypothetical protein